MELRYYYNVASKRLWLIILLCLVGVGSSLYYTWQQTPMYTTSTTLLLSPAVSDQLLPYSARVAEDLAPTYIAYLKTEAFAELVIEKTGLDIGPKELVESVSAKVIPNTKFFEISATSSSPQRAQLLANTIAEVFIDEIMAQQRALQSARKEAASDEATKLLKEKLEFERDYYEGQVAFLRRQIANLEAEPPSEEGDKKLLELKGQLLDLQKLLVEVMSSLAGLQPEQRPENMDTVTVVEPASLPTAPDSRNTLRNVLFALASSLALGVGLAFFLEYLDYTVRTPEELDELFGSPTLGVVGYIDRETGAKSEKEKIAVLYHPSSAVTESYRSLRTNIQFADSSQAVRSLLVTSAGPKEGKTLTAANLAVAMAQAGKKVILVDTDLRRPSLHRLFDVPNRLGFTNLFIDNPGRAADYLQETGVEGLRVLTSGPLPPNPSELLGSPVTERTMEELKAEADIVIYDSPPAATVTDAVVLAPKVDAILQVVLAGETRRDVIIKGKEILSRVGGNVLGPVLNRVKSSDLGYYYYYYYRYYHRGTQRLKEPVPVGGHERKKNEERQG